MIWFLISYVQGSGVTAVISDVWKRGTCDGLLLLVQYRIEKSNRLLLCLPFHNVQHEVQRWSVAHKHSRQTKTTDMKETYLCTKSNSLLNLLVTWTLSTLFICCPCSFPLITCCYFLRYVSTLLFIRSVHCYSNCCCYIRIKVRRCQGVKMARTSY